MFRTIIFFLFFVALLFAYSENVLASPPRLSSQRAIIIDFDTGEILFEHDAHTPHCPASMTKAMTAFIVFQEIEAGNISLDTPVEISENVSRISRNIGPVFYQGVDIPLNQGSVFTVDQLLHLSLLPSSNGAPVALAELISGNEADFVVRMNETAAEIGMWSDFRNAHGSVTHLTNAYSLGIMIREFITRYPDILRITSTPYFTLNGITHRNTNLLLSTRRYPEADGFKTGTTVEAGRNLGSTAVRDGRRIIVVNLGAPSQESRYSDNIALLEYGFAEVARLDELRALSEAEREAARLEKERLEAEWQEHLRQEQLAARFFLYIEDIEADYSLFPRMINGRPMAQAYSLLMALGAGKVNIENGNALAYWENEYALFISEQPFVFSNGELISSVSPQIVEDEIFIPVDVAANLLGYQGLEWDGERRLLRVTRETSGENVSIEEIDRDVLGNFYGILREMDGGTAALDITTRDFDAANFIFWLGVILGLSALGSLGVVSGRVIVLNVKPVLLEKLENLMKAQQKLEKEKTEEVEAQEMEYDYNRRLILNYERFYDLRYNFRKYEP